MDVMDTMAVLQLFCLFVCFNEHGEGVSERAGIER